MDGVQLFGRELWVEPLPSGHGAPRPVDSGCDLCISAIPQTRGPSDPVGPQDPAAWRPATVVQPIPPYYYTHYYKNACSECVHVIPIVMPILYLVWVSLESLQYGGL